MRSSGLSLLLLSTACSPEANTGLDVAPSLVPGAPVAGVAETNLDLPIGAPMGGYSARCSFLGGASDIDGRDSNYIDSFEPSVGVQTRPRGKALWLENGDQNLVLIKMDLIYSFDGLVTALETALSADTGLDMKGHVVVAASHSHASYGNFSDQVQFYLGGDKYNQEIFTRLVGSLEAVALDAWERREPAAIGLGLTASWDPDNQVYSDRRDDNDDLQFFDDIPAGTYKDPNLWVLRVDTADGDPMGLFFGFGMHGTVLDDDSPMLSIDSTGHVELALQEAFDRPVVVAHLQGGAGDASPRGSDDGYARLETIGEYARDAILGLWDDTPTSADPISLDSVTHGVPQDRDQIHVRRDGTTDLYYAPYEEGYIPDDIVFDEQGQIVTPVDEFNTQYGAGFCGAGIEGLSGLGSLVPPYDTCVDVALMSVVLQNLFALEDYEIGLPLPESKRANATAALFGPLPIREADGSESLDSVLFGFFPGEPTALYTEQFRRRAAAELGLSHAIPVGYAQDHEGYLLIPEDWLEGGYEPNINIWGPLQAEHIMEGLLDYTAAPLLTDIREPQDPLSIWQTTSYLDRPLPEAAPDLSPDAGTAVSEVPDGLWLPIAVDAAAQPEPVLERVGGLAQLIWVGGDPGVDQPVITLQRQDGTGAWNTVLTHSGRDVNDTLPDILLVHLPSPTGPAESDQTHYWWAAWQSVGEGADRMGVPVGTYRLHVVGRSYAGGASTWPWPTSAYSLDSAPFAVTAAELSLSWDGSSLSASLPGPAWGYRLIDMDGNSRGSNPARGATLSWELEDGSEQADSASPTISGGAAIFTVTPPDGAVAATVTDAWGNTGRLSL